MKLWKYMIYAFVALACPVQIFAQTDLVKCDGPDVKSETEYVCIFVDGVYHAIEDVTCTFKLSLDPGYGLVSCISRIERDGAECWSKKQSATEFSYEVIESGRYQLILEEIELDSIGEGGKDTICKKISFPAFEVKIYNAPIQVCYGEAVDIEFNVSNGSTSKTWQCECVEDDSVLTSVKAVDGVVSYSYTPSDKDVRWKKNNSEKETVKKTLRFTNGSKVEDFEIRVYKKPLPPVSIEKKGDGTSDIFIARSSAKDVKYEFGDGNTLVAKCEKTYNEYAFYRYEKEPADAWVRTYWEYTEQNYQMWKWEDISCYSEKKSYNLEHSAPSRALRVGQGHFFVNLEEEAPAVVALYRLDGKIVKERHYAPQIDFDEKLDFDGVVSGIYILKCTVGEQQVVRRIVVR